MQQALASVLTDASIKEADSLASLEQVVKENPEADLVLLDLKMPGAKGFSSLLYLRQQCPEIPVIICSAAETAAVAKRAQSFGAVGFIPKSASINDISQAVLTVLEGGLYFPSVDKNEPLDEMSQRIASLTPQQYRVLTMLSDGVLNKQIAYELNVSEATIKAHMTTIMKKLGVNSRTQAALIAQQLEIDDQSLDLEQNNHDHA